MSEHRFGGPWTELKLDAVQYYLQFYTKALSRKGFKLWYVDAFAGSGSREVDRLVGGILEGAPLETRQEVLAGSARRALAVQPAFSQFVFIEMDSGRARALEALKADHPDKEIAVLQGDSNQKLLEMLQSKPWSSGSPPAGNRGVLFLDPYAMTVPWSTLVAIAKTKAFDVWYLFPLGAVGRQLAHDFAAVDRSKSEALDRIFGTTTWREDLYDESAATDMFSLERRISRTASSIDVQNWFITRLAGLFSYVPPPIPIVTSTGQQSFSLIFLMSSDNLKAIEAAKNCMKTLSRKFRG